MGGRPLGREDAAAFADLWARLANEFHGHAALYGYELMNEPNNLPDGPDGWAYLCQIATNAIRTKDTAAWVLIPGYGGQGTYGWPQNNPTLNILDSAGKLLYAAHVYFDDGSGRYALPYDASPAFPRPGVGAYPDIGVERILPFRNWLANRNAHGIFTEYGIPDDDPRWLQVLDRFLAVLDADLHIQGGTYCEAGPVTVVGCGRRLSVEPVGGQDRPQMAVLAKYPTRPPRLVP